MPSPRKAAPRRRLTADARREQLLETARAVFMRQGLGGTTLREISDAADVNIALLYRHFDSKEELFELAVAEPLERALEGLVAHASEQSVYINRPDVQRALVTQAAARVLDAVVEITPLLGVVLFSEHGAKFYRDHLAPAIGTIAEAADVAKPFAKHRPYDSDLIARMMIGVSLMYGLQELFGGRPVDREAVTREMTDLMFEGVVPR